MKICSVNGDKQIKPQTVILANFKKVIAKLLIAYLT